MYHSTNILGISNIKCLAHKYTHTLSLSHTHIHPYICDILKIPRYFLDNYRLFNLSTRFCFFNSIEKYNIFCFCIKTM